MKPERNCTTCRHFRRDESATAEESDTGECRLLPPVMLVIDDMPASMYPAVDSDCDCSQWKAGN